MNKNLKGHSMIKDILLKIDHRSFVGYVNHEYDDKTWYNYFKNVMLI